MKTEDNLETEHEMIEETVNVPFPLVIQVV